MPNQSPGRWVRVSDDYLRLVVAQTYLRATGKPLFGVDLDGTIAELAKLVQFRGSERTLQRLTPHDVRGYLSMTPPRPSS